jgi:flagellar basal body rod protein FlgG
MKHIFFVLLLVFSVLLGAQEIDRELLEDEFLTLLIDLSYGETVGYKRHHIENNDWKIDFSQGNFQRTNRILDFSIIGNSFFKIILADGRVAYTRAGEFSIDSKTNTIITIDGYNLYDSIIVPPGFLTIYIESPNKLMAIYPNGEKIICGLINTYEIDTSELYEGNIPFKTFEQMFPDFIKRTGDIVVGIRGNGKNDSAIYFYDGNNEIISDNIVINNYLETSNVDFIQTYIRLLEINHLLYQENNGA